MKLGLIGTNIQHSLSPELYKKLIGTHVKYDLIDVSTAKDLPSIDYLAKNYDGINITAPFKKFYLGQVKIDKTVEELHSINTISFVEEVWATNTDYYGLKLILPKFKDKKIVLLGNGSMARITLKIIEELNLNLLAHYYRNKDGEIFQLDLSGISDQSILVINACSRDFIFQGKLPLDCTFLDYNYRFTPHDHLKSQLTYLDGLELLELQAQAAVEFWKRTNPKLK